MSDQSNQPVEIALYDFLRESFDAASPGTDLFELELHDTIYQKIKTDNGVRIGEAESDWSPVGAGELKEFDAQLMVVCFSRIVGTDKTERQAALQKVFNIHRAVVGLIFQSPSLGGRVCDNTLILRAARGYDAISSDPYAVVNQPLVFNLSGEYNFQKLK